MKILMYGDLHFQDKGTQEVDYEGQKLPVRGINAECLATCFWVAQYIVEYGPDIVVNMGDIVESVGQLDMYTLYSVVEGMDAIDRACKKRGAQHFVLVGNHDQADYEGKFHAAKILSAMGIRVVDGIDLHKNLAFISYRRDAGLTNTMIQSARDIGSDYLFLHTDIKGARLRGSTFASEGLDADFVAAKAIFVGHHHHPQVHGTRTFCVGSCMYHDYRDTVVDLPRGILIYDTGSGAKDRFANPYTSVFWNVDVKRAEDLALIPQRPEGFVGRLNLRVRSETEHLDAVEQATSAWPEAQIIPISHDNIIPRAKIDAKDSPLEILEKHIDSEAPDELDRETLKKLGKEALV